MGVPKFYRWISERYPCLSELVKENQIPDFDNLYLDMNGIIHSCSHPNDDDPHFRISEEQIFKDIFHYIEVLFRIIRPKKSFFMAVDGVAPRAKMNQQRGRRFMSAYNAMTLAEQAKQRGEVLPTEERFDSNCITPGTAFMVKLHEQLKYFVRMKISSDDMWRGIKIYLSGHDVPGEGEHKIMDFIRYSRSQVDHDPNTRHCLYGLDADLMMLGVCSHEPHFSLLREEVKFNRPQKNQKAKTANPDEISFHLLHLSLLREYIDFEFSSLHGKLKFEYNVEKIIDDWVLMGFLVGNDFIPNLPHMHINEGALPRVYNAYCTVLPTLDGYINENGQLNLSRFEKFMEALSQLDRDHFGDELSDLKWLEGKSRAAANTTDIRTMPGYKPKTKSNSSKSTKQDNEKSKPKEFVAFDFDSADEADMDGMDADLKNLILRTSETVAKPSTAGLNENSNALENAADDDRSDCSSPIHMEDIYRKIMGDGDDDNEEEWNIEMEKEFKEHKKNYYKQKLDYTKVTKEVLHEQAVKYVTAIQWNLHYYYNGCCSWSWFYPHHYSPYLSDIKGFSGLKVDFDLGEPFLPFQQLLAVLPAASKKLLPEGYQKLMTSSDSPIIDFYPGNFETDLNGKKQDWEAVVLIPFIEQNRLLKAMAPVTNTLTNEEKLRNRHTNHLLFVTSEKPLPRYPSSLPGVFPDLDKNIANCIELDKNVFRISPDTVVHGLLPGVKLDVYFPGFPTLKHIPVQHELKRIDVKVFQANSRNDSVVLKLESRQEFQWPVETLARRLLGKEILINWPHMIPAIVYSLHTKDFQFVNGFDKTNDEKIVRKVLLTTNEKRQFVKDEEFLNSRYYQNRAVDVGKILVLVQAKPLLGKRFLCDYHGQISVEKQWTDRPMPQILQTIVDDASIHDPYVQQYSSLRELFPIGCEVFLLSNPFYGHEGVVTAYDEKVNKVKLHVRLAVPTEPDFNVIFEKEKKNKLYWFTGHKAAEKLGVSSHFLSRITGTVFMVESRPKLDNNENASNDKGDNFRNKNHIGLNLKFNKKNEEVPDYTRKDSSGVWMYSSNVLRVLDEYEKKFSEIFEYLHNESCSDDIYYADEIWAPPQDYKAKIKELTDFMKSLPCYNAQHQSAGTDTVDERMIRVLEEEIENCKKSCDKAQKKIVAVNPKVLFRPCLISGNVAPDSQVDYQLYDRVVNVRDGFTVPIGLRGTVVGVHVGHSESDTKLDVIFDEEFLGGLYLRGTKRSGYRVPAYALVNLSYGVRMKNGRESVNENPKKRILAKRHSPTKSMNITVVNRNISENGQAKPKPIQMDQFGGNFQHSAQPVDFIKGKKDWVPSQPPPIPMLLNRGDTAAALDVLSENTKQDNVKQFFAKFQNFQPDTDTSKHKSQLAKKDWVPAQLPPVPPIVIEQQKFNGPEFVAKFALPACVSSPPLSAVQLPVDPHSAFSQVEQVASSAQPPNFFPDVRGCYNADRKEDRLKAWTHVVNMNYPMQSQPPTIVNAVPQQNLFNAVPQQNVFNAVPQQNLFNAVAQQNVFNALPQHNMFNAVPQQSLFNAVPQPNMFLNNWTDARFYERMPPPPVRPIFSPPQNPQQYFQQMHSQVYPPMPPPQARENYHHQSHGHNLFVPMQVTKKQPAPAYVKNISVASKEQTVNPAVVSSDLPHSGNKSQDFRPINEFVAASTVENNDFGRAQVSDKPYESGSTRPKSAARTSRLAVNFSNMNK